MDTVPSDTAGLTLSVEHFAKLTFAEGHRHQ